MKITERDLQKQKEDNERKQMLEKHRDMLAGQELMYEDFTEVQMRELEEECKKATRLALDNYNQALATEQAERLREQHRREERENVSEIWHTATSDMMTERAEVAERQVGVGKPSRAVTDRWKGMSPAQLNAIYKERVTQCVERQKQREKDKRLDAAFGLQLLKVSHTAEEEEQRAAELRRQKRAEMDQYNKLLAKEHQIHQEHLNKIVYTNKPTKDYFHQFNTSSR